MLQKNFNKKKHFSSLIDNFNIHYCPNFLNEHQADKYFKILENELFSDYKEKNTIKVGDKEFEIGRKTIAFGDINNYKEYNIRSWDDKNIVCKIIKNIKHMIEIFTGKKFNFVLINRYENGMQAIGYHRDKEILYNKSDIIGISLGANRYFRFKSYNFIPQIIPKDFEIMLDHGSLLAIYWPSNKFWLHSVPKTTKVKGVRISLTFRNYT